ncbi:MAG: DHH family phosphoesterase [Deltaproteobacteria bacterium]|nr:DHH family phosphoesterase [Deltaproteobacteria bacterium]
MESCEGQRFEDLGQRLLTALEGNSRLVILTHNNPDPDAFASACALATVICFLNPECRVQIAYGGIVGRSENRTLMRHLPFKAVPFSRIRGRDKIAYALVDTQPRAGNNVLPLDKIPAIVIDHHPPKPSTREALHQTPFVDIRTGYGSCTTIVTEYLQCLKVPITTSLATALVYGISSETQHLGREASLQDRRIYNDLVPLVNMRRLSQIEFSRRPREHFLYIRKAIDNAFVYRQVIGSRLGPVENPDVVAEVADFLLLHERMSWSIVTALYEDKLIISLRAGSHRAHAGKVVRELIEKLGGTAGGHNQVAGGQLDCQGRSRAEIAEIDRGLIVDFLQQVTGVENVKTIKPFISSELKDLWAEGDE